MRGKIASISKIKEGSEVIYWEKPGVCPELHCYINKEDLKEGLVSFFLCDESPPTDAEDYIQNHLMACYSRRIIETENGYIVRVYVLTYSDRVFYKMTKAVDYLISSIYDKKN